MVGSTCRVSQIGTDRPKVGIKRLSIVNGAQTCYAIFDAMKDFYPDVKNFEHLAVLFRAFETDDPEMINKIAISTNNQNRINSRDLRANDEIQIKLELDLASHGISYVRKRGLHSQISTQRDSIDALKVGQILLAYRHFDPARAKRDSDSIFTDFYSKVFVNIDVKKLVEGIRWYWRIEEKRTFIE